MSVEIMNTKTQSAQFPVWQGGKLRCIERIDETHESASFVLGADAPVRFEYLPGQFLTISVEVDGAMQHRAYSISSSPTLTDRLTITVKRVHGGQVSNYLCDQFRVGDQIDALAPVGEFHLAAANENSKLGLLSAGSGVTPVMAIARWMLEQRADADIHFIHSAHSERDIIFREELQKMAQHHANFRLDFFLSKPEGKIACHTGRLTTERLSEVLQDAASRQLFLCGNQAYMEMVAGWHQSQGLPVECFHQESFAVPAISSGESGGQVFHLSAPAFGKMAEIADGQILLEVMEAESLPIIGACRSGVCGSCKCKVSSGDVERLSTVTLTPEEVEQGYALACSTRAMSDVTVELVF